MKTFQLAIATIAIALLTVPAMGTDHRMFVADPVGQPEFEPECSESLCSGFEASPTQVLTTTTTTYSPAPSVMMAEPACVQPARYNACAQRSNSCFQMAAQPACFQPVEFACSNSLDFGCSQQLGYYQTNGGCAQGANRPRRASAFGCILEGIGAGFEAYTACSAQTFRARRQFRQARRSQRARAFAGGCH